MLPLKPQQFPPCASGADEAMVRRLINELPRQTYEKNGEKVMGVTTYKHYKGGWYEAVHDPAVHAITGETFVVYRKLGVTSSSIVARHTETDDWFTVRLELSGSAILLPTDPPTSPIDFVPLWARHRAMFHGILPDGRHRFVRRTATAAAIAETVTRANAHLAKALAHLDSDDLLASSHAAAEIRNAQRVLEQGEPK